MIGIVAILGLFIMGAVVLYEVSKIVNENTKDMEDLEKHRVKQKCNGTK